MKYRQLGKSGIKVSEIGFGTWGLGGTHKGAIGYGATDDRESKEALKAAFDSGVNFYDTSNLYGFGHSEELIGDVFRGLRDKIIIASKVGFVNFDAEQDFSVKHINASVEASLNRLKTDYIDLYQLHSPPVDLLREEPQILSAMQSLKREGKIRAVGISARSPAEGIIAADEFDIEAVQVNFNLIDQRVLENGLLDRCFRKGIGIIVRTPLSFGFLTGKYSASHKFEQGDHRGRFWDPEQIEEWTQAYKTFIEGIAQTQKATRAQIALRFCLSWPQVSTIIPGMLNKSQVNENVASSRMGELNPDDVESLLKRYSESIFSNMKLKKKK